ncbi:MAG TPA: enoyl-CoA hydratase-related protein [Burkholderiales bacterium]|nr:enoyl-CoA hydratase-related protein [Burkholderiales bacterium]
MANKVISHIDADGNATVLLNRPEVHNAFDPDMVDALSAALKKLEADSRVRAIVLTGAGKNFSAGADIEHMKRSAGYSRARNLDNARATTAMFKTLYSLEKPTIACVRGAVRGGGVGLVAACDIAVGARSATFRLSEVRLGIIPAMVSPYVIAAIGERMAHRYMLTGEELDVAEAFRIGLVHDICEDDELNAAVGRMLAHLYAGGPNAITAMKRLIPQVAASGMDAAVLETTARSLADIRATSEAQEGLSAFLEKRKARWVEPAPQKKDTTRKRAR